MIDANAIFSAEILLNCKDFTKNLVFFTEKAGFKLTMIFPADSPRTAILLGYGLTIRLQKSDIDTDLSIHLISDDDYFLSRSEDMLKAPNGAQLYFKRNEIKCDDDLVMPPLYEKMVIQRIGDGSEWVDGRAGMQYRDLIPNRLGGRFIASHIRIIEGGPVPDYVHHHHIRFQMIYCYKGWVKAVYEDQGEAFIMNAGDCVLQPPHIRHQVLECSDHFEVIEIGCPAEHKTLVDHTMELPTSTIRSDRKFNGQKFVFHKKSEALEIFTRKDGFNVRDTGIHDATDGEATVNALTPSDEIDHQMMTHNAEFLFLVVLSGSISIEIKEQPLSLEEGDACSIPINTTFRFIESSSDLELLEIALPGNYEKRAVLQQPN